MEGNGNRKLKSESNLVKQGHDFDISTETLDRVEKSEMFEISIKNTATAGSPTENTMMHGVTKKSATSSSFSERVKNTLRNFFPLSLGTDTVDEVDTHEEEEDKNEIDDFKSQISLNRSTHENEASTNMKTSYSDRLGVVRTKNKTIDGIRQSRKFMTMTNSDVQPGKDRSTGSSNTPAEREANYEETSRHTGKTKVSTSTKLPGTSR